MKKIKVVLILLTILLASCGKDISLPSQIELDDGAVEHGFKAQPYIALDNDNNPMSYSLTEHVQIPVFFGRHSTTTPDEGFDTAYITAEWNGEIGIEKTFPDFWDDASFLIVLNEEKTKFVLQHVEVFEFSYEDMFSPAESGHIVFYLSIPRFNSSDSIHFGQYAGTSVYFEKVDDRIVYMTDVQWHQEHGPWYQEHGQACYASRFNRIY